MKQPDPDSSRRRNTDLDSVWQFGLDLWIRACLSTPVGAALELLFSPLRIHPAMTDAEWGDALPLSLTPCDADGARALSAFGVPLHRIAHESEIVPAVESLVTHLFARTQRRLQGVHMGMVAWNGCGVLLPGDRGSGKSTLSLWLAQHGATYFGDDLIGYAPPEDAFYGLPKAVTLKRGSFDLFPEVPTYQDPLRGPVRYILPDLCETGPLSLGDIACIVFPEYMPYPGKPQRLPPGWAALALVQQLLGGVEWNDAALELVARLARIPAYSLPYSSLETATTRIREMAGVKS